MGKKPYFACFASKVAQMTGRAGVFVAACAIILIWGISGPLFNFSDTWQLIINTSTTIITFLMVFIIQNTQNRETQAFQLKLDELIRATQGAHLRLINLEEMDEKELKIIRDKYSTIAREANKKLQSGQDDSDTPEIIFEYD